MHATPAQVLSAFANLTDDELLGLMKNALVCMGGTRFTEPLDLVHEVLHLLLEGRRHWPLGVDFCLHIAMVSSSVADAQRQLSEAKLTDYVEEEAMDALKLAAFGRSPSVEDELIEAQERGRRIRALRRSLDGDPLARQALEGAIGGLTPAQTRAACGIPDKEFDSARKRVERRIRSHLRLH